jgi:hypothetical protein
VSAGKNAVPAAQPETSRSSPADGRSSPADSPAPAIDRAARLGKLRELFERHLEVLTTSAQDDRSLHMDMENAGELVTLGTDIVRLGGEMKEARAELAAAQARVAKLDAEIQPKLLRHAQLIQQAAGVAFPAPHSVDSERPAWRSGEGVKATTSAPLPDWAPPIANLIGPGGPLAADAPAAPGPDLGLRRSSDPTKTVEGQLKQRVKDYLKRQTGEEGISATDVADVLKVDALLVREAMREMRAGR